MLDDAITAEYELLRSPAGVDADFGDRVRREPEAMVSIDRFDRLARQALDAGRAAGVLDLLQAVGRA